MVYIVFSTIHGFRHPLGILERFLHQWGGPTVVMIGNKAGWQLGANSERNLGWQIDFKQPSNSS